MAFATVGSNKRLKLDFSKVTVIVGETEEYTIHKCFTKSSKFLEAAVREPWQECHTKTIRLPEADPQSFSIYLQWLYTGEVVVEDEDTSVNMAELPHGDRVRGADGYHKALCKLAILADQLDDQALRNKIIDLMLTSVARFKMIPSPAHASLVWSGLPEASRLRKLFVDLYATTSQTKILSTWKDEFPAAFSFELMIALTKVAEGLEKLESPIYANRCKYHEHGKDEASCTST